MIKKEKFKKRDGKNSFFKRPGKTKIVPKNDSIRLNKFIANSGICSRREADKLIESGIITVNGRPVTEMGFKIKLTDDVRFDGQRLKSESLRYVLLNKPKNYSGRVHSNTATKTVMHLTNKACKETIYPIDRLNKFNTGLVLLTNDKELSKKLTNPNKKIKTIFHVTLDKNLAQKHLNNIQNGIIINNDKITLNAVSYISGKQKNEIGIENFNISLKIITSVFEKFGYQIIKIDRVSFAGLTKKDLPKKHFRHLSQQEVNILKRL